MSITALSSEELAKSGISSTQDLGRAATGVTMPFYGGFLQPSIRGVSSTGANLGDNSNVALYIDGVYQPQQIATLIDLPDVQQIEILKGPQGALYGQNATGGAILVNSLEPSFTPSGKVSLSYGNYDHATLRGYVTSGITEGVAFSVAGGFEKHDGFRRHVLTGERDRGLNSKVVRGKLLFAPSDSAKITVSAYYSQRFNSFPFAGVPYNDNSVGYFYYPGAPKVTSSKQFSTNPDVGTQIRSYGGAIKAEFDLRGGTLTSMTAIQRNRVMQIVDLDYTTVNFADMKQQYLKGSYFTQEINYASDPSLPFSYLVGGFYLKGNEEFDSLYTNIRAVSPTILPLPNGPASFAFQQYGKLAKRIFAAYAELTYKPVDRLVLTAGGRYTSERQHAFTGFPVPVFEYPGGAASFEKFTPRITARYEIAPDANLYANWGQGFKSGIINTANFAQAPVRPEKISAWEAGLKARVGRLNINLAGFYYDYKDLQVVAYNPPDYIQQNAASARIKGFEFGTSYSVTPELSVSGGFTVLDGKYLSFPAAQDFVANGFGNTVVTRNLSGLPLLRSPKFTGNFAVDYKTNTSVGTFGAFGSLYYNSGSSFDAGSHIRQGKYATVDGEISFSPNDIEQLRFVVWGKNLTDKAYLGSALTLNFADGVAYADPRTFGIRIEYGF